MLKFIKYKFQIAIKILIPMIGVIGFVLIFIISMYTNSDMNAFELTIMLVSDKFYLTTLFTIPAIIIIMRIFLVDGYESLIILKTNRISAWFIKSECVAILQVLVFISLLYLLILLIMAIEGFSFSNIWSTSSYQYNTDVAINTFDFAGIPFLPAIAAGLTPIQGWYYSFLLLFCRIVFWIQLGLLIYGKMKRMALSTIIIITLAYLDVYFYDIVDLFNYQWIMPFEHSIITGINGERPPISSSFIYWGALIAIIYLINRLRCCKVINRIIISWGLE